MEEYYLMWLTRIDGIGLKRAHRLLEHFGSAEAVWRAEPSAIRRSAILGEKLTEGLLLSREEDQLNDWIIELEEKEMASKVSPTAEGNSESAAWDLCPWRDSR